MSMKLGISSDSNSASLTYAEAGVDIDAGNALVERIKPAVKTTDRKGVLGGIGGFGGLFDLRAAGYEDAILVAATDGVGTKLKLAHIVGRHDTIGIDLVAMCVNDLLAQNAEPLFFLDYYACGHLSIDVAADVVGGIALGCSQSGCALIGGETAEMPGMYTKGDYDLAGFVVGAAPRGQLLPRKDDMTEGDVLLGLASSGVHSNGYSLVRAIVEHSRVTYETSAPWDERQTLGDALLTPTKLYVKSCLPVMRNHSGVKAFAHITGGGITENLPRVLPPHLDAVVHLDAWNVPEIFIWLQIQGNVPQDDMLKTFNCGIGAILVVSEDEAQTVTEALEKAGEQVYRLGRLAKGRQTVIYD